MGLYAMGQNGSEVSCDSTGILDNDVNWLRFFFLLAPFLPHWGFPRDFSNSIEDLSF